MPTCTWSAFCTNIQLPKWLITFAVFDIMSLRLKAYVHSIREVTIWVFGLPFLLYKSNTLVLHLKDVVFSAAGIGGEVINASKDGINWVGFWWCSACFVPVVVDGTPWTDQLMTELEHSTGWNTLLDVWKRHEWIFCNGLSLLIQELEIAGTDNASPCQGLFSGILQDLVTFCD